MILKIFAILCALQCARAALFSLPSADVEKVLEKLQTEKPYLKKSPNDASLLGLTNVEGGLHGKKIEDAKNLVDLAQSLNLTILVKALEETGMDNIIDHEGKVSCVIAYKVSCVMSCNVNL